MTVDHHTFLFTDLVGFTALTESDGDDHAADVALEFYSRVRPLLRDHRVEEVKALGDGLLLRGEDPAEAIRLGVRIVDELDAVDGFPPVRVGMHTGPAVERGGDWYGRTVNVAARLCSAAAGGEVLVSEATGETAGKLRAIELAEPRLHWLKNVTEPVSAMVAMEREQPEPRLRRLKQRASERFPRAARFSCPRKRAGASTIPELSRQTEVTS